MKLSMGSVSCLTAVTVIDDLKPSDGNVARTARSRSRENGQGVTGRVPRPGQCIAPSEDCGSIV